MPRIVVEVMPKPELLDPQGTAITRALDRLGLDGLGAVRQGKRFEVEVEDVSEATLAAVRQVAETLLSNPVIEDVVDVRTRDDGDGTP